MKKETIFYSVVSIAILIIAVSFLLLQYIKYKQLRLAQEKAVQECVEKTVGINSAGFIAANAEQKCIEKFLKK